MSIALCRPTRPEDASPAFEHDTAWALWVLVEHLPHQGHLHDAQLSPGLKRWTCILRACRFGP